MCILLYAVQLVIAKNLNRIYKGKRTLESFSHFIETPFAVHRNNQVYRRRVLSKANLFNFTLNCTRKVGTCQSQFKEKKCVIFVTSFQFLLLTKKKKGIENARIKISLCRVLDNVP